MIVIVCATDMEAGPITRRLKAEEIGSEPFSVYSFGTADSPGRIIVTDMGRDNAARGIEYAIDQFKPSQVINAGICGSLSSDSAIGELFRVESVSDGDSAGDAVDVEDSSDGWPHLRTARLVTVARPVFEPDRKAELAAHGSIVDMEGFVIASACRAHNIPCTMLKGVTDTADASGKSDIKANIRSLSTRLAGEVADGLRLPPVKESLARRLLNFIKFEHTIFSLPLLFSGAWIGAGGTMPELRVIGLVLMAGIGGRSLGMAVNRIFDRKLDALNARTAVRELPSGKLSLFQAYMVAVSGFAVYMTSCALLGEICLYLSPIPLIPLIGYSLLKRFTSLCHFGIGLCLSLAPLGAFVAASGSMTVNTEIILLTLFTFCWISGYDIIYALQDIESDRKTGVHSIPAWLGEMSAQVIAGIVHAVAIGALALLWLTGGAGLLSLVILVVAVAAMGFSYLQHLPLHARFFPSSAVAGIAGALIPLLGEL